MALKDAIRSMFSVREALKDVDPLRSNELPSDSKPEEVRVAVFDLLFERSKKTKEARYHGKWLRNHELYRNRHWPTGRSKKLPQVTINVIFSVINRTKAILTDNTPIFEIGPGEGSDQEQARKIEGIRRVWWRNHKVDRKIRMNQHNAELYGPGIIKLVWDPNLEQGLGDAKPVITDPFSIFPVGEGNELQEWQGIFHAYKMPLGEIIRLWPKNGPRVQTDDEFEDIGESRKDVFGGREQIGSAQGNTPFHVPKPSSVTDNKIPSALVKELWIKDYSTKKIKELIKQPVLDFDDQPMLDDFGNPLETMQEVEREVQKYPGNIRQITYAGDVILHDVPNPSILIDPDTQLPIDEELARQTYLWDKPPFIKIESNSDTVGEFGFSVIEQIEEMVLELDRKFASIIAYLDRQVKPPLIIPKDTQIDTHDITNLPSMILKPTNSVTAQGIRILPVPSLPADFVNSVQFMLFVVDVVTGINDVMEGRKPKGIAAASAIVALQEKGAVIFREKISNLEVGLVELGQMYVSHVQNFYTEQRKITIAGPEKQPQPLEFRGADFRGKFDFNVQAGSTLPMNKLAMRAEAGQLFVQGAIDRKALLETLEWPNSDEIIGRMDEAAQLKQALEQQQQTIDGLQGKLNQIVQKLEQKALGGVI